MTKLISIAVAAVFASTFAIACGDADRDAPDEMLFGPPQADSLDEVLIYGEPGHEAETLEDEPPSPEDVDGMSFGFELLAKKRKFCKNQGVCNGTCPGSCGVWGSTSKCAVFEYYGPCGIPPTPEQWKEIGQGMSKTSWKNVQFAIAMYDAEHDGQCEEIPTPLSVCYCAKPPPKKQ